MLNYPNANTFVHTKAGLVASDNGTGRRERRKNREGEGGKKGGYLTGASNSRKRSGDSPARAGQPLDDDAKVEDASEK